MKFSPPSDPDPDGASVVQELLGGKELGHIEAVATAINTMMTGASPHAGVEPTDTPPKGFAPTDLPPQRAGWAPDYAPEEIAEIARKLRVAAGLGDGPTGEVITPPNGRLGKGLQAGPPAPEGLGTSAADR